MKPSSPNEKQCNCTLVNQQTDRMSNLLTNYTPSDAAVSKFVNSVANYQEQECSIKALSRSVCDLGNLKITDCKNLTLACCNDSTITELNCTSEFLNKSATQAIVDVATSYNLSDKTSDYLDNYLLSSAMSSKYVNNMAQNTSLLSLADKTSLYVKNACDLDNIAFQTVTLSSFKGTQCSSDIVNLYNRSDVKLKCTMGAITQLLPQEYAPAKKLAWYHITAQTKMYALVLGIIAAVFFVLALLASASQIDSKDI